MSEGSVPTAERRTWEALDSSSLVRLATRILWIAFGYAVVLLGWGIYPHARWIHPSSQAKAYLVPMAVIVLLAAVLSARAMFRIAAALFLVPMVIALFAANLVFALPHRTVHMRGWRVMAFRNREAVASSLQKQGIRAYPTVSPAEHQFGERMRQVGGKEILPLAGISRVRTIMCEEGGLVVAYDSDDHGFNNPAGLWRPDSVDVALIGDSFVFGSCVHTQDHFATLVRDRIPRTLNVSAQGIGPLSELALLREYVARVRPKRVLWFFFEGNDMENLEAEKNYILRNYFDSSFTQDLASRQKAVDSTLTVYADSLMRVGARSKSFRHRARDLILLRDLRLAFNLEVATAERSTTRSTTLDFVTLRKVLAEAKRTTEEWRGTMTLVYLPEEHRLDSDARQSIRTAHDIEAVHSNVVQISRDLGLSVIDVGAMFTKDPHARAVLWRPRSHYSPYGNRVLANTILAYLRRTSSR